MFFNKYMNSSLSKTRNLGPELDSKRLFLNGHDYDVWYKKFDKKT